MEEQIPKIVDTESLLSNKKLTGPTYAAAVGRQETHMPTNDFRAIILASKNEELADESERKRRACNLVIHGKEELSTNDDKEFMDDLIKEICIGNVKIKTIERIGQVKENKRRPMKVVFANVAFKEKVLGNLRYLKGKDKFIGISVKEDYTFNERLIIAEVAKQAREKNSKEENDSAYIWRVRGNTKNGWSAKRLKKLTQVGNNSMETSN